MKQIFSLAITLLLTVLSMQAQDRKPVISFDKTTHNFGSFEEAVGTVTTTFAFKNSGNAPLLITRTAASCGCTTPTYPKEPIAPGKTGEISVTYNAKGRPGPFQKTVYVMTNTEPDRIKLIIKGNVQVDERSKKKMNYRAHLGNLYIKSRYLPLFDVFEKTTKTEIIPVYNDGDKPMTLSYINVPEYLRIETEPATIPARGEANIVVTFDTEEADDWGLKKGMFNILVGSEQKVYENNQIIVSADIREDFSRMTAAEKEKAPHIQVSQKQINFGEVDGKKKEVVVIENTGANELIIRKIATPGAMFEAEMSRMKIKPGKSAELTIEMDPKLAKSRHVSSQIQIISNDPSNATELLRLRAYVK